MCGICLCLCVWHNAGSAELQQLHVALAPGYGGARRAALQKLRKAWEKDVKFGGKV